MRKMLFIGCICLLMGLQFNAYANDDFLAEQRHDFDTLSPEEIETLRQSLLTMADDTLKRLYDLHPDAEEKIKNAYGYGVFQGQAVNLVFYVAGNGLGVVFDNKTKTPVYMQALRAGTGPGVGYKSVHGVVIFDNELVFDQFTNVGLQVSASGDAVVKGFGQGGGKGESVSLVPGVSLYQMVDHGVVVQANWGATEFVRDTELNK